jgi:hypothetical protein
MFAHRADELSRTVTSEGSCAVRDRPILAGSRPEAQIVDVNLQWRDAEGTLQRQHIALTPGRHTVILGTLRGP